MCGLSESQIKIRETCLKLLARREHSQLELLNKLAIKGYDRTETAVIIDELAVQGWQSNRRFGESYARYRILKGYGPVKVSFELQQRGVDSFDLDEIISEVAGDWGELLEQVYKKKYPDEKLLTNNEWLSRSRFLQQRGFTGEMIKTLFDKLNLKLIYS